MTGHRSFEELRRDMRRSPRYLFWYYWLRFVGHPQRQRRWDRAIRVIESEGLAVAVDGRRGEAKITPMDAFRASDAAAIEYFKAAAISVGAVRKLDGIGSYDSAAVVLAVTREFGIHIPRAAIDAWYGDGE